MNELLLVIQVWVIVFLLVNVIVYVLNKVKPNLKSIFKSMLMVSILVPTMLYIVIPGISHVNAASPEVVFVDSHEGSHKKGEFEMNSELHSKNDRYLRGLENLKKIDGEAGENVIESLKDISPDLGRYIIEYPFGDIYNRPGLDLKSREIATIAALTAMGDAKPQLKVHIQAGLNVGLSEEEITEIIMQMSVYAGFPRALNGIQAAKEVFTDN